jgi:hypothetical protein
MTGQTHLKDRGRRSQPYPTLVALLRQDRIPLSILQVGQHMQYRALLVRIPLKMHRTEGANGNFANFREI